MKKKNDRYLFYAESAYAESIFLTAKGEITEAIKAIKYSLKCKPDYAPAILSMGSVEYQRGRKGSGKKFFISLLTMPDDTPDLIEIIDEAGTFLIQSEEYSDGLDLFRAAVVRFPEATCLHQGVSCCAGHLEQHQEAVKSARLALKLSPEDQEVVNDLGWCLFEAGKLQEAQKMLERAVAMNPSDELARENLRLCNEKIPRRHLTGVTRKPSVAKLKRKQ